VFGSPATTAAAELLPRGPVSRALHPSNGSRVGQRGDTGAGASALGFTAVPTSQADDVIVPDGYVAQVICRWGDPVSADGPAFRFDATNTADDQALQYARATTG